MKVRLATANDIQSVIAICQRFHDESRFRRYPFNQDKVRQIAAQSIDTPLAACILLAEQGTGKVAGLLAGFVAELRFADARVAQDHGFYVLPEHRGGSAALKLLLAFRRWAENRQAVELNINQNVDIDQARFNRFMRHMGFACCGSNFVLPLPSGTSS